MKCEKCGCNLSKNNPCCLRCGHINENSIITENNYNETLKSEQTYTCYHDRKDPKKEIKCILIIGIVLIFAGIIVSSLKIGQRANMIATVDKTCPEVKNKINKIVYSRGVFIISKSGDVYYYLLKDDLNSIPRCQKIKELKNVSDIMYYKSSYYIKTFDNAVEKYYIYLFNSYTINDYNYEICKEVINTKFYKKDGDFFANYKNGVVPVTFADSFDEDSGYIDKNNNIYDEFYDKKIFGREFDGKISPFYVGNHFHSNIGVKSNKYFYLFDKDNKLLLKDNRINQFSLNSVSLIKESYIDNKDVEFVILKNGDLYSSKYLSNNFEKSSLKDNKLLLNSFIKKSTIDFKRKIILYTIYTIISVACGIIIMALSYFGRNKSFGETYKKVFVCFTILALLSGLVDGFEINLLFSILIIPLLITVFYTICKRIVWHWMNISKRDNFVLFAFLYYLNSLIIYNIIYVLVLLLR